MGSEMCIRDRRNKNASALTEEIESELKKKTATEWEPILQSAGVPSARLRSLPEALSSPQVKHRGFVQTTDDGVSVPTLPFRIGGVPAYRPASKAPTLGEQSTEIIDWLNSRAH